MTASGVVERATGGRPRLLRSELLKIRTTNVWWVLLIGAFAATAAALVLWIVLGDAQIDEAERPGGAFEPSPGSPEGAQEFERQMFELSQDLDRTLRDVAAEIYTSGQFFGLLVALLLGVLLVTNEYHHQTATATFLATPRRTTVVGAKLVTAVLGAGFFWVFSTVISIAAGAIFLSVRGYGPQLGEWPVLRAILFNGLGYGMWGMLGVGLGVLIRSQLGAVLVGAISYVIGTVIVQNVGFSLAIFLGWDWVLTLAVGWPGIASQVMISPEPVWPDSPAWWVGALVLAGYAALFGTVGTLLTRRRDIS